MKKSKLFSKIASIVAACLMITSTAAYVSAEEANTYTVYDDAGNAYVLNEGEVLGVLYDKYGNVKEWDIISPHYAYINGTEKNLAPGERFTTYQYEVKQAFSAGFFYNFHNSSTPSTTPGGRLKIVIQDSATIGGARRDVCGNTFSTTYSAGSADPDGCDGPHKTIGTVLVSSSRPYYNAYFENVGSSAITVSLLVASD